MRQRLVTKLAEKQKREGKKAVTEADRRRWQLPQTEWQEWEVPFDTDPDWPQPLQDALSEYRQAWRAKIDEINACIAANAETEELVDKPDEVQIKEVIGEHAHVLELRVAKEDLGKVIGKGGAHASAIRTLMAAASGKEKKRYILEIIEY